MNTAPQILFRELCHILQKEESKLVASFPLELRLGLIELARASDGWFMHTMTHQEEESQNEQGLHTLYQYGWNTSLNHFIDASCHKSGFPMMQPTRESLSWAHSVIQHCGRIAQVQQYINLWKTGLLTLTLSDTGEYCFSIVGEHAGLESLEQQHFVWLHNQIAILQKPAGELLNHTYPNIREQLALNVAPCPVNGIRYSANPDLDSYYEQAGILRAQLMLGQDSFSGDALFGGHEFNLYRAVATTLIGWTLKHVAFCNTLASKYPATNMSQILTIHNRSDDLSRQIADALEITQSEAVQALKTLILNTNNKTIHCTRTAGPSPPFIEVGKEHLLWSVRGCLDAPFEFMMSELKRQYTSDWDRNLNFRESYFRHELYELFPQRRFIKAEKPFRIKIGEKTLTDVDACIYDSHAKTLGIFQLKWQELFGSDMIERASRKSNFMRESNHWVDAVNLWLDKVSTEEIAQKLRLPRASLQDLRCVHLFVVGRHSAFFSDSLPDERAAWGIWHQLVRYSCEGLNGTSCNDVDPLTWLFEVLKKDAPSAKPIRKVERHEILLGGIKVVGMPT